MSRRPIRELLEDESERILILDGGQGTELERRGIDVNHPIWSSSPFLQPDFWTETAARSVNLNRQIVESVLCDFANAGADIIATTTFQASFEAVMENSTFKTEAQYKALLEKIINFTRECIDESKYLAGSIGPWGARTRAEFTGDYGNDPASIDYYEYNRPQLECFCSSKEIDLILFETIPNFYELKALLSWDESIISKPFCISISVHNEGVLRDGTSLRDIASYIKSIPRLNTNFLMLGINCVNLNGSPRILDELHHELPGLPLAVYPNSGEVFDTVGERWLPNANGCITWDEAVKRYITAGARIIGGCCRTTPDDIKQIVDAVRRYSKV